MQNTMTEKDMFLQSFERECRCTQKILDAYPADRGDLRPAPKSKTATELAFMFTMEQGLAAMGLAGKIEMGGQRPPVPATFAETVTAFGPAWQATLANVKAAGDDVLNRTLQFPTGKGQMGEMRAMDVLWLVLMDMVHHRGQLSVYLRMADGKLPSIYGPTADEPWM